MDSALRRGFLMGACVFLLVLVLGALGVGLLLMD
ncbi:Uncharacterised protein [Mycobacteroides abscessus subsp. abscessus]|nr:Uncharacterised protein [Mycobacteroides abscessus subsp. abscessus]